MEIPFLLVTCPSAFMKTNIAVRTELNLEVKFVAFLPFLLI